MSVDPLASRVHRQPPSLFSGHPVDLVPQVARLL